MTLQPEAQGPPQSLRVRQRQAAEVHRRRQPSGEHLERHPGARRHLRLRGARQDLAGRGNDVAVAGPGPTSYSDSPGAISSSAARSRMSSRAEAAGTGFPGAAAGIRSLPKTAVGTRCPAARNTTARRSTATATAGSRSRVRSSRPAGRPVVRCSRDDVRELCPEHLSCSASSAESTERQPRAGLGFDRGRRNNVT